MELATGTPDLRSANSAVLDAADPLATVAEVDRLGLSKRGQKSSFRERYLGVAPGRNLQNAQVSFYATCCDKWFDTVLRHNEMQGHAFQRTLVISLFCKVCKGFFRKDLTAFVEDDEFCPHCDNQFVVGANFEDYDEKVALEAAALRVEETTAARIVARRQTGGATAAAETRSKLRGQTVARHG
jgi:uncharacterized CHY-type Zn-finger protein